MFGFFKKEEQWIIDERNEQDRIVRELKEQKLKAEREQELEKYRLKEEARVKELVEKVSKTIKEDVSFLRGCMCLDTENNIYIYIGFSVNDNKQIRFSKDYVQHYQTDMTSIRIFDIGDEKGQEMFCNGLKNDRYRWLKFKKQIEGFGVKLELNN